MNRWLTIITGIIMGFCVSTRADIAVVVNSENDLTSLDKRQVTDLFLGRYVAFPNGIAALPLDHPVDSNLREQFYKQLTGKTVPQINAYWAKLIFSGRATPPRVAGSANDVLDMIKNNKNAIAYIDSDKVDASVKTVLVISAPRYGHTPKPQLASSKAKRKGTSE